MISVAVQKGNFVHVYDEKNRQIMSKSGQLQGYTSTTVSVKVGNFIHTFNEKGHQISSHAAK